MNAVTVRIPPLRDRGGDVMLLANYFLNRFNREFGRTISGFTEQAARRRSPPTPGPATCASWRTA